jgi:addiction module RelB/DinJ family antitoxin
MNTVINFKTEKNIKDQAQKIAKSLGLPLGTIMNNYLREFIQERKVVFTDHPMPNSKTAKELDKILADIKKGKNLSPAFSNAKDAIAWLKK